MTPMFVFKVQSFETRYSVTLLATEVIFNAFGMNSQNHNEIILRKFENIRIRNQITVKNFVVLRLWICCEESSSRCVVRLIAPPPSWSFVKLSKIRRKFRKMPVTVILIIILCSAQAPRQRSHLCSSPVLNSGHDWWISVAHSLVPLYNDVVPYKIEDLNWLVLPWDTYMEYLCESDAKTRNSKCSPG